MEDSFNSSDLAGTNILVRHNAQNPIIVEDESQENPVGGDRPQSMRINSAPNVFRLCGKKFAMTFPQCDMDPDVMLQNIKNHWGEDSMKWCVVSKEQHEDGNHHLHIGLWLKNKYDTRSARCFDLLADKHGDYKIMTDPSGWITYIIKDGHYASFGINPIAYIKSRKKRKAVSFLEMAMLIDEGTTVRQCKKLHPGFVLQHLAKLRTYEAYSASNVSKSSLTKWTAIPALNLTGA